MQFLILGICVFVGLVLAGRWFLIADPKTVARVVRWAGIILGAVLALFLASRIGITGLIPLVIVGLLFARRRRMLAGLGGSLSRGGSPTPGKTSDVETAMLRMTLDHDSGEIAGSVRSGRFEGSDLHDLSFREVLDLYLECQAEDEQSVSLLETFLDRVYGADWRERADAEFAGAAGGAGAGGGKSAMTADEAYEVLGLDAGASEDDVKEAHHRLMMKMHPDQGGSTYLASKINQAKDLLLESV